MIEPEPRHSMKFLAAIWLTVAVAGFGVMSVIWMTWEWPEDLPGWGDYRAAVVGDGLLVPTLTVALILASSRLESVRRDVALTAAGCTIGILSGAFVQYAWLTDDSPHLNWAMLEVHHFTGPGWYHAVFLTAMTGLLGATAACLASRAAAARSMPYPCLIATCSLGFATLQTTDAVSPAGYLVEPTQSPGGIVSASMTIVAVLIGLALLTPHTRADAARHLRAVGLGALGAAAIGAVCLPWPDLTGPGMLVAMLVTVAAWVYDNADLRQGVLAQSRASHRPLGSFWHRPHDKFKDELAGPAVGGSAP